MSNLVSRKEVQLLAVQVGGFVAKELQPLVQQCTNLVERVADMQNQITALRARLDEVERQTKRQMPIRGIVQNLPKRGETA